MLPLPGTRLISYFGALLSPGRRDLSAIEICTINLTTNLAAVVCVSVSVCAKFDQFLPARSHFDSKRNVPKFLFA